MAGSMFMRRQPERANLSLESTFGTPTGVLFTPIVVGETCDSLDARPSTPWTRGLRRRPQLPAQRG